MSKPEGVMGTGEKVLVVTVVAAAGALAVRAAEWLGIPDLIRDAVDEIISSPSVR